MAYYKAVCNAGRTKIIRKYYCYHAQPRGRKRLPKRGSTIPAQQKVNDRHQERRLTALLNHNCNGDWWYITWTYEAARRPGSAEEFRRHVERLLRQLRKIYKSQGLICQYIWTGEVGARGGCHIHMVLSPIDTRLLKNVWPYGWVTIKPMSRSGQYSRLASYFIKYFRKTRGTDKALQGKAYNPSRNLVRPPEKRLRMKGDKFQVRIPAGWYLDKTAYPDGDGIRYGVTEDGYEYLQYILVKEGG